MPDDADDDPRVAHHAAVHAVAAHQILHHDTVVIGRTLRAYFFRPAALRLWIANPGTSAESGRVEIIHCKDAPNCRDSGSCAQCTLAYLDRRSCP